MNDMLVSLGRWSRTSTARRIAVLRSVPISHYARLAVAVGDVVPIQPGLQSGRGYLGLDSSELFVQAHRVGFTLDSVWERRR